MHRCKRENRSFPDSEFEEREDEGHKYMIHLTRPAKHTDQGYDWPLAEPPDHLPDAIPAPGPSIPDPYDE